MKTLFVLLAATLLQFSPAHAQDETKHVPDSDVVNVPPGFSWSCTTKSKYNKYKVILATSREEAAQVAVNYCVRGGGSKATCRQNLNCDLINPSHQDGEQPQDVEPWYDWARGTDGYGYCFLMDQGGVLNDGKPVGDFLCDLSKTTYKFGVTKSGAQACMQWTPYGHAMNQGKVLDPILCREGKGFPVY